MAKKAWETGEFWEREELRPLRFQLELIRPELVLNEYNIKSLICIFGSARLQSDNKFYKAAVKTASKITKWALKEDPENSEFVIATGGGPGIMEAGNRGAKLAGGKNIGLGIDLPFEQHFNPYITDGLDFDFKYFATRKINFLIKSKACVVFPGGIGTIDELSELITLIQTNIMEEIPIIFYNKKFWDKAVNFKFLVKQGTMSKSDLKLFRYAEKPKEVLEHIKAFYKKGK
jgi:uncharacterized protein (TIGR00730 family)